MLLLINYKYICQTLNQIIMGNTRLANIFVLNGQQFAIAIEHILQIVRAVEVTITPQAPPFLHGVIDYHGQIIPVINIRYCLGIKLKEIHIDDRFLILQTPNRVVAIVADQVNDIISLENIEEIQSKTMNDKMDFGTLIRLESGIVFIYNIEKLISPENEIDIKKVLDNIS